VLDVGLDAIYLFIGRLLVTGDFVGVRDCQACREIKVRKST
jgi:hypothetical protein